MRAPSLRSRRTGPGVRRVTLRAASADRGRRVGLDLARGAGHVPDADFVDRALEPLAPDTVATDRQRIAGGVQATRQRLADLATGARSCRSEQGGSGCSLTSGAVG